MKGTDAGTNCRTHGLKWTVSGLAVLDGVTFTVPPGSFTGLIGPNGSGKSTVLDSTARRLLDAMDDTVPRKIAQAVGGSAGMCGACCVCGRAGFPG